MEGLRHNVRIGVDVVSVFGRTVPENEGHPLTLFKMKRSSYTVAEKSFACYLLIFNDGTFVFVIIATIDSDIKT